MLHKQGNHETVCSRVDLPIGPIARKSEGPATTLKFLGIKIDSQNKVLCLHTEKLQTLKVILQGWQGKKACRKRNLLSLIGLLLHACKVVKWVELSYRD